MLTRHHQIVVSPASTMKEKPLQYRVRGTPVPTTRTRGTNYPESTLPPQRTGHVLRGLCHPPRPSIFAHGILRCLGGNAQRCQGRQRRLGPNPRCPLPWGWVQATALIPPGLTRRTFSSRRFSNHTSALVWNVRADHGSRGSLVTQPVSGHPA